MLMFAPMGDDVKQADAALRGFRLSSCVVCEAAGPVVHDKALRLVPIGLKGVALGAARPRVGEVRAQEVVELEVRRYDCRACASRITVAADCLLPGAVYPAAVREWATQEYLSGRATYRELAEQIGCSKSTCWRWMRELTRQAAGWLQCCREQLAAAGEPVGPVVLPEGKRALWQRRRIRTEGMLEGLLVAEALAEWVDRLRAAWRRRPRVLPVGRWAFGKHVLERLGSRQAERQVPP
jgi:transposase-like protein